MKKEDELLFAEEVFIEKPKSKTPWKLVIADDEEEVHAVTRMVLDNFTFEERGLELLSAYSGEETKALLAEHPDTAVLLLDVVMEEDNTGLEVVKYIREVLANTFVRIILRTGQPGQAPERQVTMEYDINDYKEKTELTAQKLFTTIIGLLRAYRDLRMIEKNRKGLEQIAAISSSLFEQQALKHFMVCLLKHLSTLLYFANDQAAPRSLGLGIQRQNEDYRIVAAKESSENNEGRRVQDVVSTEIFQRILSAIAKKQSLFFPKAYLGYFSTNSGSEYIVYIQSEHEISDIDRELLLVLETNISVAFENIDLKQAIIETQREVIFTLGEIVELRSQKKNRYIKTVAEYSYLLARKAGFGEDVASMLRLACPLHDVGKLGIPDAILHKGDSLTDKELTFYKTHPLIGYHILKDAKQPILQIAAKLALQHHERWDGQGYPNGLRGEAIDALARVSKLAETFYELRSLRVWDMERVILFFQEQRGKQFDPSLVDLLLEHLDEFLGVKESTIFTE